MANKVLTWEEKLEQKIPLSFLDQVKADATRITLRRIREEQEEAAIKAELQAAPRVQKVKPKVVEATETETPQNSKKGN